VLCHRAKCKRGVYKEQCCAAERNASAVLPLTDYANALGVILANSRLLRLLDFVGLFSSLGKEIVFVVSMLREHTNTMQFLNVTAVGAYGYQWTGNG
jgi:hypothetical protein